ncbi:winged helix-turn-helix domain-containing protein [Caulobacter sp. 1776]|uniref:ATP-binding protein n=1 Tax=Caulobacter sp. 1776 TaxID=3156420 RepID=UPI0033930081
MRQSSLVTIRAAEDGKAGTRLATHADRARVPIESVPTPAPTLTSRAPSIASPTMPSRARDRLSFGGFVLAPEERRLTKDGVPVELGGRSFDLLLALVEQPGRIIPKRELIRRVWPDVTVEDVALRFHMTRLRRALGDGVGGGRLITTQVGVGYGFIGALKQAHAAPARQVAPSSLLPSRLDRLIGRERDLRQLIERVSNARLLTIVGPAGVGKTSLAVEAAHELASDFTDGATFVELAAVSVPDMLVPAVAAALGLTVAANSPATMVLDYLRGRRLLLILDAAEHLAQAIASLCEAISATARDVRVIVTSRQALRARNEQVHRLTPHDESAAIDLFRHHLATAGGVDIQPEDAPMIATICERLDGLALPIELAALRAATHGIGATSRLLGEGPSLLWPGRRTAPPHQRTLKASLDWSFDLLANGERTVLERVSRLDAPFTLEAALEIAVERDLDRATANAALDALIEKSLILADAGQYRFPETVRLYARERCVDLDRR